MSGNGKDNGIALVVDPVDHYMDIYEMPDPVKLGVTIDAINSSGSGLYFKVNGTATYWSFTPVTIGYIAGSTTLRINLDRFGQRAKPSVETTEAIIIKLEAYLDSGYRFLRYTATKTINVHFINSNDGSWTIDVLNNFDDGTIQGWSAFQSPPYTGYPQLVVVTAPVLSPPYALRVRSAIYSLMEVECSVQKAFDTPNKTTVYAVWNVRCQKADAYLTWNRCLKIQYDTTTLNYLGRATGGDNAHYFPATRYLRMVVPLPSNIHIILGVIHRWRNNDSSYVRLMQLFMDDFKIISK